MCQLLKKEKNHKTINTYTLVKLKNTTQDGNRNKVNSTSNLTIYLNTWKLTKIS